MRRLTTLALTTAFLATACLVEAQEVDTWVDISPPGGEFAALAGQASDPDTVTVGALQKPVIYRTVDGGQQWADTTIPDYGIFPNTGVTALAVDPVDSELIYAGGLGATGVFTSEDAGSTWASFPIDLDFQILRLFADSSIEGRVYASVLPPFPGRFVALGESRDRGRTWTAAPSVSGDETSFAITPDTRTAYVGTASDSFTGPTALRRSTDQFQTWETLDLGVERPPLDIIFDSFDSRIVTVATGDGLYQSTDSGDSWRQLTGLTISSILHLAAVPGKPHEMYAAGRSGLIYSTDRGATWQVDPQLQGLEIIDLHAASDGQQSKVYALTETALYSKTSPADSTLQLRDGRFLLTVDWQDFDGGSGSGRGVQLTNETGYFWFFDPDNIELTIKVLDGRPLNGAFWVFYGSLTNVQFELRVTDTLTGESRTWTNESGNFASVGDTAAFPDAP